MIMTSRNTFGKRVSNFYANSLQFILMNSGLVRTFIFLIFFRVFKGSNSAYKIYPAKFGQVEGKFNR